MGDVDEFPAVTLSLVVPVEEVGIEPEGDAVAMIGASTPGCARGNTLLPSRICASLNLKNLYSSIQSTHSISFTVLSALVCFPIRPVPSWVKGDKAGLSFKFNFPGDIAGTVGFA